MVAELAYQYNGIVWGEGTPYNVTKVEGLDPVDIRDETVDKAIKHGSYTFASFLFDRRIIFEGFCLEADHATLETRLDALRLALRPQVINLPLIHKKPGSPQKRVYAIPTKKSWPEDNDYTLGYVEWMFELIAGDPLIYDDNEQMLAANGVASNAGTIETLPVITITGASNNPRITNSTYDQFIQINRATVAGDSLIIDFPNQTIKLNGTSVYNDLAIPNSVWWALQPGNNTIAFTGITGTVEMRWRSAWY